MLRLEKYGAPLKQELKKYGIDLRYQDEECFFLHNGKNLRLKIVSYEYHGSDLIGKYEIPLDYLIREPIKIAASIVSKMGLNQKVFARNCETQKLTKFVANHFLDHYHVMNSTQSAYNFGLIYRGELLAVASFSKGRKMKRLPENKRSFELIRFCCKSGFTITGGLSKLVKHMEKEKNAGDIMTYVDKQWSDGTSFKNAGFKLIEEMQPNYFLIDKKNFRRQLIKDRSVPFDSRIHYLTQNAGNLKMIYTPYERS